ncbi:uncharacterized protein A1O5_11041 [Cladophialophora psammophila CBS 110553]|uniref:Uncharacterized protein n=1 Tax=Cladophialophora psammophila CBS 110553 TaxID=1182543 RepID=W9WLC2_9EURO|nr:uncharacterized protein A1O5_11041 [Cladophialophora psammophila CBS 110553]EXJ65800.1 hypothetical protein A1O5_11041 [Cladophialophora psammophila CBS 110553]
MSEPRRSGRQRKVNPRYANDGWDKDTLRILRAESESSGSSPAEGSTSSDSEDGKTHNHVNAQADDVSLASAASIQSSDVETPDQGQDDEDISLVSDDDVTSRKRPSHRSRPYAAATGELTRSRGVQPPSQLGKRSAYANIFGPEISDLVDVLLSRDTWLMGRDITIPSRQTLSTAIEQSNELDQCGTERNDGSGPEREDAHVVESLIDTVRNHQVYKAIGLKDVYEKYLLRDMPGHSAVLGAWGRQTKFELDYLSALDLGMAWLDHEDPRDAETSQIGEVPAQKRYHQGWLLNVGEKVQCFAWAVGAHSVQYLAVAVKCTSYQRRMAPENECEPSAFHPSPSYQTGIQIWAFRTRPTSVHDIRTLEIDDKPRLAVVLGTAWGNIRQLKWCQFEPDADDNHKNTVSRTIGLLAVVSSDGHARMIAVPRPDNPDAIVPTTLRVERAGFDIPPPTDTVFTTLAFAGPTNLMLGTADGFLHSFDLAEPTSQGGHPKCYMKQQLHHTYIVALCPALPGPQPTFLASISASGDLAMTDLRSPEQDRVRVARPSFPTKDLVYSPFTRSFIAVLDRGGNTQIERNAATFLVCHHTRQFPSLLRIAKLSHDTGAATALAGSPWHPCILVGNAKGQVLATNYLRKVLPYRKSDPKKAVGAYMQKLCEYDWHPLSPRERRRKDGSPLVPEATEEEMPDIFHGHDTRPGISRFHEGFKPEKIAVAYVLPKVKKSKLRKADTGGAGPGEAVFEEEQAVTALEWNPNAACAGIVAIGWGSGIVRVQDLAYDVQSP